jgi:hypothetical protein
MLKKWGDIDREYGNVARIISIRLFWEQKVSISDLKDKRRSGD